jgi:hypothetical protein
MTEVVTYEPSQVASTNGLDPTGGRLVAWARGLEAAHRIGAALCSTAFAPAHFKNKPDDAAAAILYGDEIGFSPTQALRSIFIISGTPGMYARQMVALVLFRGHSVWTVEKTDSKVTVAGQRRGSTHVIEETWTLARATKAGYASNKKYQTDPSSMLYARAAADVCRQIAPDALAGLAVSVEELEIAVPEPTTTTRRAAVDAPKTTAKRAAPKVAPEPEFDTPQTGGSAGPAVAGTEDTQDRPSAAEPSENPDGITKAQLTKLHVLLNEGGMPDRISRLAYVSDTLDRPVESSKDLSKAEAHRVIERLQDEAEHPFPTEPPEEDGS